jgi:phospholipid transport system substrate-binding protein
MSLLRQSFKLIAPMGIVFAAMLASSSSVLAQEGPASRFLRQRHDEVSRLMQRAASTDADRERRSQDVTRILSELLDYQELSRRSLGAHWEGCTPEQREQFVALLRQLVERNYQANLERIQEFEVRYASEEPAAGGVLVRTEARSRTERRQPPVEIAYSMHQTSGAWRVFDVTTDGVSLVGNYQRQFNRIITQNGWDELIRRMQQRLESGASE